MKPQSENASSLKSTNLSLKLLNTICPQQNKEYKRSISSFQELSNRLVLANKRFNNQRYDHQTAKQWFYDKGVNLNNVQIIAKQVKKQYKVERMSKVKKISWQNLQYDKYDELDLQKFLHVSQQRIAHLSVINSFSTNGASKHMDRLRGACLKSLYETRPSKQQQDDQNQRNISENQIISELIRNYQQSNQPAQTPIHKIMLKVLTLDRFAWFRVLYYHIEMIEYLREYQDVNKMNYVLTTSIKQLQKEVKESSQGDDFWRSAYLEYRRGGVNFPHTNNHFDQQLFDSLKKIHYQLNHYQELQKSNSIGKSKKDHPAQRILKNIALGTYQTERSSDNNIDEAWNILLTSLKRQNQSQRQQITTFTNSVNSFISQYDKTHLQKDRFLDEALTAFLSLGAYAQILNVFKLLNKKGSISPLNHILFIQIFIILASNPQLIQSFGTSQQVGRLAPTTINFINQILFEVGRYTQSYKDSNRNLFLVLFTILLEILNNLSEFKDEDFKQLPSKLSKILKLSIDDLENMSHNNKIHGLSSQSQLVKTIFSNVLVSTSLQNNNDYLRLADLCVVYQAQNLIEPTFIKFIMARALQPKQGRNSASSIDEDDQIMQQILGKLSDIISDQNQELYLFLINLMEMKQLVNLKRIDDLLAKKRGFQAYLSNEQFIALLTGFCGDEDEGLLDIYIYYYQQIYNMYRLVYLAMSSLSQLRKKSSELVLQLQTLQRQHKAYKTPRAGKLISDLKR